MTKDTNPTRLIYDHASGAVEVLLPSGTRVAFKKESGGAVFSFLHWCHMQPQERLRHPLTQDEVSRLVKKFLAEGHTVIAPLAPARAVNLEELGL